MNGELQDWLHANYGLEQMRPGLERIRHALGPFQGSLAKSRIVTIAGTNGKGETTLRLSALLKHKKHYTWTSPHVLRLTERFRSEAGEINPDELTRLVLAAHASLQEREIKLSYYEFLFFVFCRWAAESPPEYLLLEVGLGGRLDAVNVFDADLLLLPSISRDHQEFLGKRYDGILLEKLGLLRPKTVLLSFLDLAYLRERAQSIASSVGAQTLDVGSAQELAPWDFSRRNQLLAYAAFLWLNGSTLTDLGKPETFAQWRPPGGLLSDRGEIWRGRGEWHFFGTHNTDGLRKLIQFLNSGTYNFEEPPFTAVVCSFSRRDPGDISVMLRMLKGSGLGRIIATTFDHPKAISRALLEDRSRAEGIEFVEDIGPFIDAFPDPRLLVLGSYYFLGAFKARFCGR